MSPVEQSLRWHARPYELLRQCRRELGDAFTLDLGAHGQHLVLSHPDAVRAVFTASDDVLDASQGNRVLEPFLGPASLLLLEGRVHHDARRLLSTAFRGDAVGELHEFILSSAESTASAWLPGTEVSIQAAMQRLTLEVILGTVLGSSGLSEGPSAELAARLTTFLNDPKFNLASLERLRDPGEGDAAWMEYRGQLAEIRRVLNAEIVRRRARSGGKDVLALLLAAQAKHPDVWPDKAIEDQLLTLVVTGYETTATALAWAFYWLDRTPSVDAELRQELARRSAPAVALPYLDAFVREVLRIHPVVPIVARVTLTELRIGPWTAPPGITVAPCIYLTHHRDDCYAEPDSFEPRRFLERVPTPYEYLPFGGGARRCLGMTLALVEMKVVLACVLRRWNLRAVGGVDLRPSRRSVTVAPSGGMPMRVTPLEGT